MRIAVVDIGTNSTRLLVGEAVSGNVRILRTGLITTRLGEGIGRRTNLLEPAIERTVSALLNFREIIRNFGVDEIVVAATSAVRDASNRAVFIDTVKDRVGLDVRVLSGAEEAEMSYAGAVRGLKTGNRSPVVIDIGGGSTEFIWTRDGILRCESVRVGAVRMTENNTSLDGIKQLLSNVLESVRAGNCREMAGVGGTITTLAAIDQKLVVYEPDKVHGYFLKRERITGILRELEGMTLEQRKRVPGLQPERADIIVAGTRIALASVEGLDTAGITASETDIMYGLLYQALEKNNYT